MHTMFIVSLITLPLLFAHAKLYTDLSQLLKSHYDFVVVGAGTAGNVIAARLTENPSWSVLVIEAGVTNEGDVADEVPFLGAALSPDTALTWNYTTTSQSGLSGRSIAYPRERVLGGSSTINFEIWTHSSEDDYNRFASISGDQGWSWNNMLQYFKKSETLDPPTDGHNTTGQVEPSVHGTNGPVGVSLGGYPTEIDSRIISMTEYYPSEFPYNQDMNSGKPLGVGYTVNSINSTGRRSSSATSYLQPSLSIRSNVDVLIQTTVTKLVASSGSGYSRRSTDTKEPTFDAVQMSTGPGAKTYTVYAQNEIILSAGLIGTPQILQLSGIGDSKTLSRYGIKTLVSSPSVGQNLTDHPLLANHWLVNSTTTLEEVGRNTTLANDLLVQWEGGSGRFTDPGANNIVWGRVSNQQLQSMRASDPSAGSNSAQFELLPVNGYVSFTGPTPAEGYFLTIITTVVSPTSRGSVTITSSNPFAYPSINPNLLATQEDMQMMVAALQSAQSLIKGQSWKGYVLQAVDPPSSLSPPLTFISEGSPQAEVSNSSSSVNTAQLEEWIRGETASVFHPVGTARMSKGSDGVVDSNLLVKGAQGLRIVDASVFPFIPSAHPQACVYAVAERAADLIKESYNYKS